MREPWVTLGNCPGKKVEGLKPKGPGNERTVLVGAESGLSVLWGASVRVPGTSYRREVKLPFPVALGVEGVSASLSLTWADLKLLFCIWRQSSASTSPWAPKPTPEACRLIHLGSLSGLSLATGITRV